MLYRKEEGHITGNNGNRRSTERKEHAHTHIHTSGINLGERERNVGQREAHICYQKRRNEITSL